MSNLRAPKRGSACPCQSGRTYGECCMPFHRNEREPPDAEALMRSRYAAYAAGDIEYLVRTLHPDHKDREMPPDVLRASLRAACRDYRYTGLEILEVASEGDRAQVHFRARVFERGVDLSFAERSRFERLDGAWRYLDGETVRKG